MLGLMPSGFVSNSSWTVRVGRSESRAADVRQFKDKDFPKISKEVVETWEVIKYR